jgi:hypothetical protein
LYGILKRAQLLFQGILILLCKPYKFVEGFERYDFVTTSYLSMGQRNGIVAGERRAARRERLLVANI